MQNQLLNGSSYFGFPSLSVTIFTLLLALVLGTVIALTYKLIYQDEYLPKSFFLAITLSSAVAAIIMMAVGDNQAIGLAALAAIFLMRFRVLIRNPRIIIFIFASLSIGIATGKLNYTIAISGTTIFCYIVILLYYSPFESNQ